MSLCADYLLFVSRASQVIFGHHCCDCASSEPLTIVVPLIAHVASSAVIPDCSVRAVLWTAGVCPLHLDLMQDWWEEGRGAPMGCVCFYPTPPPPQSPPPLLQPPTNPQTPAHPSKQARWVLMNDVLEESYSAVLGNIRHIGARCVEPREMEIERACVILFGFDQTSMGCSSDEHPRTDVTGNELLCLCTLCRVASVCWESRRKREREREKRIHLQLLWLCMCHTLYIYNTSGCSYVCVFMSVYVGKVKLE